MGFKAILRFDRNRQVGENRWFILPDADDFDRWQKEIIPFLTTPDRPGDDRR